MDELRKDFSHPTAYEVYLMVRPKLPNISLGTVYRNLELLSDFGLIHKIELAGSKKRFDGVVRPHYHVRCIRCGRVDDVPLDWLDWLQETVAKSTDYDILSHRLEFEGVCPECRAERERSAERAGVLGD
jgi:Fur family ferric uptake transcriptional regulator